MKPAFKHESQRVLWVTELTSPVVEQFLFERRYSCLIMPEAIDPFAASHIAKRTEASPKLTGYVVEPSFMKRGKAWFENTTEEERAEHIARTLSYSDDTVALCRPFAPPTDSLKIRLDLLWNPGVFNQRINGRPLYFGLPRAVNPGGEILPHFDWIKFDSPEALGIEHIQRQIAVNYYVQVAESGGQIALWDHLDLSPTELIKLRIPGHAYALDERALGEPAVVISPPERSLVFFDATKPHSVRKTNGARPRVTFSSFLGYYGNDRPLTLWS